MTSEEIKRIIEFGLQGLTMSVGFFYVIRFLWAETVNRKATLLLVLLFSCLSFIEVFTITVDVFQGSSFVYYLIPVFAAVSITLAPTVYLYIRSIIVSHEKFQLLKHFLPAIIVLILDVLLFLLIKKSPKGSLISDIAYYGIWGVTIGSIGVVFIIQSIYYSIQSYRLITIHETEIRNVVSFEEEVSLKWTKVFLFGYLFFFLGSVGAHFGADMVESLFTPEGSAGFSLGYWISLIFEFAFDLVLLVYVLYIGFNGSKQLAIQNTINELTDLIQEDRKRSDYKEEESNAKFDAIKVSLEQIMTNKKPYLDTKLTIFDLSKQMDTNYKYLSRIINNEFHVNFATYINTFRIEEAKIKLKDPDSQHFKIEAIAEMVGFKSKSAFNGAFKNMVGKTPSQFRDNPL